MDVHDEVVGSCDGKRPLEDSSTALPQAKVPRFAAPSKAIGKQPYVRPKCPHGKPRSRCNKLECWTPESARCKDHNLMRDRCVECKYLYPDDPRCGKQLCQHDLQKNHCKIPPCWGSSVCDCGKQKNTCRIHGTAFCEEHGRRKGTCRECHPQPTAVCHHLKHRIACLICTPKNACITCKSVIARHKVFMPQCGRCYYSTHPDLKCPRQHLTKEIYMREALQYALPSVLYTFNRRVPGGSSRRMPDVLMERLMHAVILECQEFQHKRSSYPCEELRMMQLFTDLGNQPLVMIFFNPDAYTTKGVKHPGCFGITTVDGKLAVNMFEWTRRFAILLPILCDALDNVPTKEVTHHVLFYDGYE